MSLRHQLPAHSPITIGSLFAGALGALGLNSTASIHSRIRAHWGAAETLLTNSGTSALTLAIRAAMTPDSAIVALPAYGCYDLATAAEGAGAQVVLYDLDPLTLAPDPSSLARALQCGPAALVLVHLYGVPLDVEGIARTAARHGTIVIEDAAQGLGASVRGAPAGSLGSLAVLSFGRGKGLTGGSGGALLSNDEAGDRLLERVRMNSARNGAGSRDLLRTAGQWVLARPAVYGLPAAVPFLRLGETIYHQPGVPAPISRAAASTLNQNWERSLEAAALRVANAARLLAAARRGDAFLPIKPARDAVAGYLRLPLLAAAGTRDRVLDKEALKLGIIQGYPLSLNFLPGFTRVLNRGDDFSGAESLASRLLTVPTHALLSEKDMSRLESWLARKASYETPVRTRDARGRRATV